MICSHVWIITGKLPAANSKAAVGEIRPPNKRCRFLLLTESSGRLFWLKNGLLCAAPIHPFHIDAVATVLFGGIEEFIGLVDRLPDASLLRRADAADAACDAGFL